VEGGNSVFVGVRRDEVVSRGDEVEVPPVGKVEVEGSRSNGLGALDVARGVSWSDTPGAPAPPTPPPPAPPAAVGWEVDPPVFVEEPGNGELAEFGVVGQN
jgi:hypothetical protein